MWIQGLRSLPPASMTRTRVAESAESRLAKTQPAEPAPTMTKSYSASKFIVVSQRVSSVDLNRGALADFTIIVSEAKQSGSALVSNFLLLKTRVVRRPAVPIYMRQHAK